MRVCVCVYGSSEGLRRGECPLGLLLVPCPLEGFNMPLTLFPAVIWLQPVGKPTFCLFIVVTCFKEKRS